MDKSREEIVDTNYTLQPEELLVSKNINTFSKAFFFLFSLNFQVRTVIP